MRKTAFSLMLLSALVVMASCGFFGYDASVPIIATHSGDDHGSMDESANFIELSRGEESYDLPTSSVSTSEEEPSENSYYEESSDIELPEDISQEEPEEYDYKGFHIIGYGQNEVDGLLDNIKNAVDNATAHVSVYFEDIESGFSISYDGKRKYKAGSVTKAPYAKYLISSGVDLEEELTLKYSHIMPGSGSLQKQTVGSVYTVRQLIDYAVRESDNTAYKMLYERFGFDGFNAYCGDLGIATRLRIGDVWGDISAEDAGDFFRDIYCFESESASASVLMNALKNATYFYLLPSGVGGTPIAHKYGYMSGTYKVLHDVGIVYTDSPYIIAVMTDFNPTGGNGRGVFTKISSYIKAFAG